MPLLSITKLNKTLPEFFFGSKTKRRISKTTDLPENGLNGAKPESDKMNTSDSENRKVQQNKQQNTSSSKEGLSSCKRPRTPLIDIKVKAASPRSGSSRLSVAGKGIRSRKSSPIKVPHSNGVSKAMGNSDKVGSNCSFGFTPIKQTGSALDDDSRAFSPMDIGSRNASPMEFTNGNFATRATTKRGASLERDNTVNTIVRPVASEFREIPDRDNGIGNRLNVPTNLNRKIGTSLDMVDLWDPESDSESENASTADRFDVINGIKINPRKTIDFSELRQFRSRDIPDFQAGVTSQMTSQQEAETKQDGKLTKTKEGKPKPKLRMTQNMKALLTYPPASPSSSDSPSSINFKDYCKSEGRKSKSASTQNTQKDGKPKGKTIPILAKPTKKSLQNEISPTVSRSRKNESSPQPPQNRVLNVTYDFTDELSTSPKRVNFNNFVTVEDGEMSTLEMLKSSNNSAQLIKQKYLGKLNNHNPSVEKEPHQSKDLSPRDDVYDIQLAY